MPPKVFISYSHDSDAHRELVRALADRLRSEGVDAWIDQYASAPPEGWPRWMEEQIREADFVLMVCTPTYLRRVEQREEPGKGLGVLWEANIIYNELYPTGAVTAKFIPLLPAGGTPDEIPSPVRYHTHYHFESEDTYHALYRRLTDQPEVVPPPMGGLLSLPRKGPALLTPPRSGRGETSDPK